MRKLALPEEVLLQIEQPARYIGNEFNSVVKDKEKVSPARRIPVPGCV